MARSTLSEIAASRFRDIAEKRGTKKLVADRLGFKPSTITPYVKGERSMNLDMLEALSDLANVPPGELLLRPGEEYRQLNADEAAVVRALRLWPPTVRQALLAFVTFFANETPVETGAKTVAEYYRHFGVAQRRMLVGAAELIDQMPVEPERITQLARLVESGAIAAGVRGLKARRAPP